MTEKKFRAPALPLFNIDPFTSLWSCADRLFDDEVRFWTGKPCPVLGFAEIDGEKYRFAGKAETPAMTQTDCSFDSFSTKYTFEAAGVEVSALFTSPLLPDDNFLLSRPVSYLNITVKSLDGNTHNVIVSLEVPAHICLDNPDQRVPVFGGAVQASDSLRTVRMGGQEQAVLGKTGDGVGIDWGFFYLSADGEGESGFKPAGEKPAAVYNSVNLNTSANNNALFLFAYDDIEAIVYFGERLKAYWKKDGMTISEAISGAYEDYAEVCARCAEFDKNMTACAVKSGGKKYAELLQLALRQVMAAHKLVADSNGEILYISKECFSNGCAATVDVSYPSMPVYLLYNPELVKGMMRPVFKYAASEVWPFDFAPHDVGTYPILNGQVYSGGVQPEWQMPVEECGNMLIMAAAVAKAEGNAEFFAIHRDLLQKWADYLLENGVDPDNQLCTDDFAGHLSHNCNLSVKAVMGVAGYGILCEMWGMPEDGRKYREAAGEMAEIWHKTAANGDGSYRLAFDRPGTFSIKYNAVWDKIWGTGLFDEMLKTEPGTYPARFNVYGLPLDNRSDYTKSDWLVWTAALTETKAEFESFIEPLWLAYSVSPSRVPMTDWYFTITSVQKGFQHRTVQGGLWIKILADEMK